MRDRRGANIGSPVAANFRFVAHSSQRDAYKSSSHRFRHRPAQRSLSDAGRADEAQNWGFADGPQFQHGKILEYPFLDLLQIVMVAVEDLASTSDIDPFCRKDVPRESHQPVQIGPAHRVFRGGG